MAVTSSVTTTGIVVAVVACCVVVQMVAEYVVVPKIKAHLNKRPQKAIKQIVKDEEIE